MDIFATSDTHEWLPAIPACRLLIVAGDGVPSWTDQGGVPKAGSQIQWLTHRYNKYAADLLAEDAIYCPGNHDSWAQIPRGVALFQHLAHHHLLLDSSITIDGVKIYGSPWTVAHNKRWAFEVDEDKIADKWANIPTDLDILVTHQNPAEYTPSQDNPHATDTKLAQAAEASDARLHLWGHEHFAHGKYALANGNVGINLAATDDSGNNYEPFGHVWHINYDEKTRSVKSVEEIDVAWKLCRNRYRSPYTK